jgi:hypothetical protein
MLEVSACLLRSQQLGDLREQVVLLDQQGIVE